LDGRLSFIAAAAKSRMASTKRSGKAISQSSLSFCSLLERNRFSKVIHSPARGIPNSEI
jgi:hypothetical protein